MTPIGLLFGWVVLFMGGQPERTPLEAQVCLSLSSDDGVFYERAPVSFEIEIQNLTNNPLGIGVVLKPVFYKWVKVLYRRLPGEFEALSYTAEWDMPMSGHPDQEVFELNGHGKGSFALSLAADPGRSAFMFDRPGDYELKMISYRGPGGHPPSLKTPPLRIRVEPAPPSEAAALEDWDVDLAIFAQNDGSWGAGPRFRRSLSHALKFMAAHPTSLYSELLRVRSLETLEILRREGKELTELEREGYERLKPKPTQ